MVKLWENFNEAKMGIVVRHIKRFVSSCQVSFELETSSFVAPLCQIMSSILVSVRQNLFRNVSRCVPVLLAFEMH